MSLRVNYKQKIGEFTLVERHDDEVRTFKIGIYRSNALAAFVFRGKECDHLVAFFNDRQHMKNIEKDFNRDNQFFTIKGAVRLNMACKESNDLLGFFARQGHAIKPYYKQF